jgi:dihydroneopterin aldolase
MQYIKLGDIGIINSQLCIRRVELSVFLGWSEEERKHKQSVFLDIDIVFSTPPPACVTDDLQDTLCYAALTKDLQDYLQKKEFHLIEHLAREIYRFVKSYSSSPTYRHYIHVTKYPSIPGLLEGVRFSYGDTLSP